MTHFLSKAVGSREPCGLQIRRSGQWLARGLELAGDSAARNRGLLGRDELPDGCGLVIAPSQGVHTFGMRFSLDIVAVGRDGRVVKYRGKVPPRRIVLAWSAFAIIELPSGTCERVGLLRGDQLLVVAQPQ